jgi:hypothetical protein
MEGRERGVRMSIVRRITRGRRNVEERATVKGKQAKNNEGRTEALGKKGAEGGT